MEDLIKLGKLEVIRVQFEDENKTKLMKSKKNPSLLALALVEGRLDIFKFFLSKGFKLDDSESLKSLIDHHFLLKSSGSREEQDKKFFQLRVRNISFLHDNNIHDDDDVVTKLFELSRLTEGDEYSRDDKMKLLQTIQNLMTYQIARTVLKIVSAHENLRIYVDLNRTSCCGLSNNRYMEGLIFVRLYEEEVDIDTAMNSWLHEFCHFTLFAIYKNQCLLFTVDDDESDKKWNLIIKETNQIDKSGDLLDVGQCKMRICEMSASYLQTIAMRPFCEPIVMKTLEDNFHPLVREHFQEHVLRDLENAANKIEINKLIHQDLEIYSDMISPKTKLLKKNILSENKELLKLKPLHEKMPKSNRKNDIEKMEKKITRIFTNSVNILLNDLDIENRRNSEIGHSNIVIDSNYQTEAQFFFAKLSG